MLQVRTAVSARDRSSRSIDELAGKQLDVGCPKEELKKSLLSWCGILHPLNRERLGVTGGPRIVRYPQEAIKQVERVRAGGELNQILIFYCAHLIDCLEKGASLGVVRTVALPVNTET